MPIRFLARRLDDLVPLAPSAPPFFGRIAQGLGRPQLHGASLVARGTRLPFRRLQGRQGLLERPLRVGQAALGVFHDV